ncbi:hypothetical protein [Azospirillum sp.]|uniref:hypothetical protein n=1 Tax=Azospirillum sp. TaxID=34012 RepID=UPI003D74AAE5
MTEQWVIKSGDAVVFGPAPWNGAAFSHQLGLLGWSVSLGGEPGAWRSPTVEAFTVEEGAEAPELPNEPAAVLPCSVVSEPYDPRYQDRSGPAFSGADDALVATYAVSPRPAEDLRHLRISEVKEEASRRILAVAPDWKQRNLTARAAELALLYPGVKGVDLPEPERAEYLAGQAVWDRIKELRSVSNDIEAWISDPSRTADDLVTMAGAPGWPE